MSDEDRTWPWRLERRHADDGEIGPEIWLGARLVATLADGPGMAQAARRMVAAMNAVKHMTTDEIGRGVN